MKKYRRPPMPISDPRIRIRSRYMEAIRSGANIHDATEFANADENVRPKFIPINVEIPMAPKGYGKPGEVEQLLPHSFSKIKIPVALPSTNPELELVKRPMTEPAPAPKAVEAAAVAEAQKPSEPVIVQAPIELPEGWDTKDFPWPNLRTLCLQVAMKTPHSRTDGVNLIRDAMSKKSFNTEE